MTTTQITFTSLAATLAVRPAAQTTIQGVSVARMTSSQASIANAIQSALRAGK